MKDKCAHCIRFRKINSVKTENEESRSERKIDKMLMNYWRHSWMLQLMATTSSKTKPTVTDFHHKSHSIIYFHNWLQPVIVCMCSAILVGKRKKWNLSILHREVIISFNSLIGKFSPNLMVIEGVKYSSLSVSRKGIRSFNLIYKCFSVDDMAEVFCNQPNPQFSLWVVIYV